MRDRGKRLEQFNGEPCFMDASLELPCKKHPSSSSSSASYGGGICAFCLRDKLAQLVCPQCGDQRLPNCSCSVFSAYSEPKTGDPQIHLRRSNSTCVTDISSRGGFWGIKKLFRKKREKGRFGGNPIESGISDSKNEMWAAPDVVQRSRSLSTFRGGGNSGVGVAGGGGGGGSFYYDNDDGGMIHSAARASSVSGGFVMESAKRSCFSESEARMSNYEGRISNFDYERDMMARGIFTMREGYEFSCGEDPKFIDLKIDLPSSSSSEIRTEHPVYRRGSNEFYGGFNGGESSRFSVSENETKRYRKSRKGWRWLFKASSNLGKDKG